MGEKEFIQEEPTKEHAIAALKSLYEKAVAPVRKDIAGLKQEHENINGLALFLEKQLSKEATCECKKGDCIKDKADKEEKK